MHASLAFAATLIAAALAGCVYDLPPDPSLSGSPTDTTGPASVTARPGQDVRVITVAIQAQNHSGFHVDCFGAVNYDHELNRVNRTLWFDMAAYPNMTVEGIRAADVVVVATLDDPQRGCPRDLLAFVRAPRSVDLSGLWEGLAGDVGPNGSIALPGLGTVLAGSKGVFNGSDARVRWTVHVDNALGPWPPGSFDASCSFGATYHPASPDARPSCGRDADE